MITSFPAGVQSIAMSVSECLSARLSARICQKPHDQTSRNFLYMLHVAVVRSPSDDNAIHYVLSVFWITPYLPISGQ